MAPSWSCRRRPLPCHRRPLPCRCAHVRASAPCRSAAAFAPSHDTICVLRHESLSPRRVAPWCALTTPYRGSSCAVSQPVSLPLLRHNAAPSHYTIFVSQHTPLARPPPCVRWAVSRALHAVSWHMLGRVMAEPWPYRGPSPACPCLLCHNTICCFVTKPGNWAVAHPSSCKFFFSHIFFLLLATRKPLKKIYIIYFFSFSSITK